MKTINYKYLKNEKEISFNWNNEEVKIKIEENDNNVNLNNLYDFIINNINEIEFKDETDEKNKDNSLSFEAFKIIISEIKKETKKIQESHATIRTLK